MYRHWWLQIFDGDNDQAPLIKKLTGKQLPEKVIAKVIKHVANSGHMFIR